MEGVIGRTVEAGLEDCFNDCAGTCTLAGLKLENDLSRARTCRKNVFDSQETQTQDSNQRCTSSSVDLEVPHNGDRQNRKGDISHNVHN